MPPHSDIGRDDPVYFLLHIPKTAGQTLQVHLAGHCAPGVFWQSRRRVRLAGARPGDFPDFARARVICGHHIGRSLEQFFPGHPIRRIVLLRDPLELQLSLYNWQMMDHLAKGLGTYSFELHLQALPRNFIAHFLLSRWLEIPWPRLLAMPGRRKYRLLNQMLAGFWFVGAHTDCDRVIEAIGPSLGVPPLARARNTAVEMQAQTGWRLVRADVLAPARREAFSAQHRLDYALWENWRSAGFDAVANRPHPFKAGGKSSFLGHEIIRPWFAFGRSLRRRRSWRRRAAEPIGARLTRANRARNAGEWDDAARHYREVLQAWPNAPAIWVQYGHALKEGGRLAEAEQAYRQSVGLSPDTADTYLQLGHLLNLQGRRGEAVEAYLRSARLAPGQRHASDALIGLGWTAERVEQLTAESAGADR
ncbi:MAG TPA: tetratricopeptide repeat protein [Stellaceae bacterium]|jgi:hypothetical protein